MKSDIQIAQSARMKPIDEIAAALGLEENEIERYGHRKAKIQLSVLDRLRDRPDGKLILVSAITPTPLGEGKTLTTVGLGQALAKIGKRSLIAIREPSLGPVFGIKGGAAGGGYSQVVPMEDINLHFTGDIHALSAAHNLLAAMLDNHIHSGNGLGIDVNSVTWGRVIDMNDRALRQVIIGLGGHLNGIPRESTFVISVASEVMAILCLARSISDLKERLGRIVVAYNSSNEPVTAGDLRAQGAMALLLKDAIKPNLVQTLENTPAIIHGGPFGNIAHGTNSVLADLIGLKLADYLVTEAGFGTELGAEKFVNIVARDAGIEPDVAVVVATCRALKMNGGAQAKPLSNLEREDLVALEKGFPNLEKHLENMKLFGLPAVVAVNRFPFDTEAELKLVADKCRQLGVPCAVSEAYAKGGEGAVDLAGTVLATIESTPAQCKPLYPLEIPLMDKIEIIASQVYGADGVIYERKALRDLDRLERSGFRNLPICMAKTQSSISDNPNLKGRPKGWKLTVREVYASAGAGFVVAMAGNVMLMPGLSPEPAAVRMDIDDSGRIEGLF